MKSQWFKQNLRILFWYLNIILNAWNIKTWIWLTSCAGLKQLSEIQLPLMYIYACTNVQYGQLRQLASGSVQRFPIICKLRKRKKINTLEMIRESVLFLVCIIPWILVCLLSHPLSPTFSTFNNRILDMFLSIMHKFQWASLYLEGKDGQQNICWRVL